MKFVDYGRMKFFTPMFSHKSKGLKFNAMKVSKAILPVSFLLFMNVSHVFAGGNEKVELALHHKFILPEDANNNDYVGKFYSLFTYFPADKITFTLVGGNTAAFSINSASGMITVKDNSKINVGKETLIVKTSDADKSDIDTVDIRVIDVDKCVFINPTYSGTEKGTRAQPYNSWKDISQHKAGYAYLQKRGTVGTDQINISGSNRGTSSSPVMIGAYGQGNRPELNGSNLGEKAGIYLGTWDLYTEWVEVYSFVVYSCRGFETTPGTRHIRMYNCEGYKNSNNGNFFIRHSYEDETTPLDIEFRNIIAWEGTSHGIKFMASGSRAYN